MSARTRVPIASLPIGEGAVRLRPGCSQANHSSCVPSRLDSWGLHGAAFAELLHQVSQVDTANCTWTRQHIRIPTSSALRVGVFVMNRSIAERYRKSLEALASRLRDDTAAMAEQTHRASGGQADGELSNAPMHLADMGTEEYLHDLNATLLENQEYLAGEAKAALERIDQGTFGDCEACGESIPAARL